MWESFVDGLLKSDILAVDPANFKAASGLAIAAWEVMNTTGLGPTVGLGALIPLNLFTWSDPIPEDTGTFYQAGFSLSDSYTIFLRSLKVAPPNLATVLDALNKTSQFQMMDGSGRSWPGYTVTPGLNDFLVASLNSIVRKMPPQVDFSVTTGTGTSAIKSMRRGALVAKPSNFEPSFFGVDGGPLFLAQRGIATKSLADAAATTIRFQAQTAQMFSVQPDRWFSPGMISMFCDRIDPASALANKPLFGPGGFLDCRASMILVAWRRIVTVSGPTAVVAQLQDNSSRALKTVNVGSFHFSAEPGQTAIDPALPGTIIFQDNTDSPSILGLAITRFSAGNP